MSYWRPLLTCTFDGHMTERTVRYIIRLWSQQCKLSAISVRRVWAEVCGHFMKPSQILIRYEDAIFHLAEARSLYVLGSVLQHKPEHLITCVSLMIFEECPIWIHMGHLLYSSVLIYWLQERSIGTESPLYGTACERLARPHGSFDRMFGNEDTKIKRKHAMYINVFFSKKNHQWSHHISSMYCNKVVWCLVLGVRSIRITSLCPLQRAFVIMSSRAEAMGPCSKLQGPGTCWPSSRGFRSCSGGLHGDRPAGADLNGKGCGGLVSIR